MTYFRLMEVKGPQSDIIQINGSEGASTRDITKTSFLNILGHFQRTLLFDHEKSDIIQINGSDKALARDIIKINGSEWASIRDIIHI